MAVAMVRLKKEIGLQRKMIDYDERGRETHYDLTGMMCRCFLDLNSRAGSRRIEDRLLYDEDGDLLNMIQVFNDVYEEVHGPIRNSKGKPVNAVSPIVRMTWVNDAQTYEVLMEKLEKVVKHLG